jgi:hypothetical protein
MNSVQDWHKKRTYSPEELELAKIALADIRAGMDVQKALRHHPLPGRLRCAEVSWWKGVARRLKLPFPAQRRVFHDNRPANCKILGFFDHDGTGVGMRCGAWC